METPKKQHRKDNNNIGRMIVAVNNLIRRTYVRTFGSTRADPHF